MTEPDFIEGELADEPSQQVATQADHAPAMQVYNPLDAEQVTFATQLQRRQDNYDHLALHLREVLVRDKDYAKLHIKKDCDNKYACTNDYHFSDWQLLAPGADKILGVLGLRPHYPDMKDYKRATLQGYDIKDVIMDCVILGIDSQEVAQGGGSCSRSEMKGDLNNTIKRAMKRARLDAVKRLPVVSALFQDPDFIAQLDADAAQGRNNSTSKRAQTVKNQWNTGAALEVCPITKKYKGKKWRDVPTDALEWIVAKVNDKPDITRAAARELEKRHDRVGQPNGAASDSTHTGSPPLSPEDEYLSG